MAVDIYFYKTLYLLIKNMQYCQDTLVFTRLVKIGDYPSLAPCVIVSMTQEYKSSMTLCICSTVLEFDLVTACLVLKSVTGEIPLL
jgi:hypothetical protein